MSRYTRQKFFKKHGGKIILCVVGLLLVGLLLIKVFSDPHAGHDHSAGDSHTDSTSQSGDSHAGHDHSNYDIGKSYAVNQSQDGTYTVIGRTPHNEDITICKGLATKPACGKVNNSVLLVGDTANANVSDRWAILFNGMTGKVSDRFSSCLATSGTAVVVGTNNGTVVEVKDAFTGTVHSTTALPGASAPDNRSIIQKTAWAENGDLIVTYLAGDAVKTHNVKMPQK